MSFYKNHNGHTAKVINSYSVIVMFEFKTMFFPDMVIAASYLKELGFYRV